MHLLVDGHNVLFALRVQGVDHEQQRARVIDLVARLGHEATIYFDARRATGGGFDTPGRRGVRVQFARHREADALILDAVRDADNPARYCVVSNDREVTGRAAQLGARTARVEDVFGRGGGRRTASPGDARADPGRVLRGRWRFKPSDFGLPDFVDLDNPNLERDKDDGEGDD